MERLLRILMVEDKPEEAELVFIALRHGGLDVVWERVETAGELRAALAAGRWDAVLVDYTLPAFNVEAGLGIIRDFDPDLPFIVVSGTVGEDVAVKMMRAGVNDYVFKHALNRLAPALVREVREAENRRARKQADKSMLASETRYRRLFEAAQDGILLVDVASRRIFDANPFLTNLLSYQRAELVGKELWEIGLFQDIEANKAAFRTLQEQGYIRYDDYPLATKDGRLIEVEFVSNIYDAGDDRVIQCNIRDVTEKKRAEAALRAGEERLRLFVENVSASVAMLDREMRYLYVSRRWMTDYRLGERDITGLCHYEVFPNLPPSWKDTHQRCLAGAVERCDEARLERPDGAAQWIRWEVRPWVLSCGEIGGIIIFTEDVTDRKISEDAVRASEERYRTLVSATSAIVWDSPASGEFDSEQPAWTAFTGQTVEQHRGWGWLNALHPDDREKSARAWTAAVAQGASYQVEHRIRRADGEFRHMFVRAVPIFERGGEIREWVGVHTDVTDRRQAEETLHLRDRAIQAATQGLMITDSGKPDNPIMYVSPGFERITGYSSEEALGRNCRFLQGVDTAPAATAELREAIRAEQSCTVELLNYRKDGTPFWNELSIAPIRDGAGHLTHFVGVQGDVTARRNLEEQFRQAQKMEAFGQLAGGVAHDFNNLLTIINGYSDMLLQSLPAEDSSRALIAEILKAGERSADLTRQLLAFSRQQILAPRVLNLNEIVTETDKMLRRLIGEDVRLTTTLDSALWAVQADPGQVEQVLLNLAVNARDAMPNGGRLTIETQNIELNGTYVRTHVDARNGPHVLLSVTDTGSGMSPDVQARIFEPFFTTKGPGKGTGLGLATVFGIVKQSGGHVAVYSEIGVGTSFKVYLPSLAQQSERLNTPRRMPTPPRGTEAVLLAEDEAGVRNLTRAILAGCGYTVLEAATGDEAVRIAEGYDGPIHLLITDVVMPGTGGRAVSERMLVRHPNLRVLFISGYTDDAVIRHGVLREGVNFLQKPFSPAALALKVREILDGE